MLDACLHLSLIGRGSPRGCDLGLCVHRPGWGVAPLHPPDSLSPSPPAFAPRAACTVSTTLRVRSRRPSWDEGSWGPHLPPAPNGPDLLLTACVCIYDGRRFRPGDVIYHTTDGTGGCISARCSASGTIERSVYTCSPTTPAPPTTFSFSTSPLGKADALGTKQGCPSPRGSRRGPRAGSLPSLQLGSAGSARLPGRAGVLRGTVGYRAEAMKKGPRGRPRGGGPPGAPWEALALPLPLLPLRWLRGRCLDCSPSSELPPRVQVCSGRAWGAGFPLNEINSPVSSIAVGPTPARCQVCPGTWCLLSPGSHRRWRQSHSS